MRYLKITWRNSTDLGPVYYAGGFTNTLNLNVEVSKPEYQVDIEAEKDGENRDISTFKKWEKAFKFDLWATEDLVDAFTLMQMHDTITVTLQTGRQINVDKMTVGVEWPEPGCLAKLDVTFTEDYITGTNCDSNMEDGCFCEDSQGNFTAITEYSLLAPAPDNTTVMGWTVENIAGKQYTAKIYKFSYAASNWLEQVSSQWDCWYNSKDSETWIFDGQFWHLMPGYITELTDDIKVTAYIPPGTFGNIYYSKDGGGSVLVGSYTASELAAGVTFAPVGAGTYAVWITVWNHSCAYLNTESESVVVS